MFLSHSSSPFVPQPFVISISWIKYASLDSNTEFGEENRVAVFVKIRDNEPADDIIPKIGTSESCLPVFSIVGKYISNSGLYIWINPNLTEFWDIVLLFVFYHPFK